MNGERLSYRFGPLERRGLLGPLRFGQVATIGGALALGVELLDRIGGGGGVMAAIVLLLGAVGLATAPIAGRTLEEWAPVGCAFAVRSLRGRRALPLAAPHEGDSAAAAPTLELPGQPARRRARHRRAQRSRAGRTVGAARPAADTGARLPGTLLRAARPRGAGAPAGRVGNRTGDGRERPDQAAAMDRADHSGPGR